MMGSATVAQWPDISIGLWTDLTRGLWAGTILTVPNRCGDAILLFLGGLYLPFALSFIWRVGCSTALWWYRWSKDETNKRRFNLLQKKSGTPLASCAALWKELRRHDLGGERWYRKVKHYACNWTSYLFIIALAYFLGSIYLCFELPQLLSDSAGAEALVQATTSCGFPTQSNSSMRWLFDQSIQSQVSQAFMEGCGFIFPSVTNEQCNFYSQYSIPRNSSYVACPFQADVCALDGNRSVQLDTGFLRSDLDFKINGGLDQSIEIKITAVCTPLAHQGYVERAKKYEVDHHHVFAYTWAWSEPCESDGDPSILCAIEDYRTSRAGDFSYLGYTIAVAASYADEKGNYTLTKALKRTNADVMVFAIGPNGIDYEFENDDPVFRAHKPSKHHDIVPPAQPESPGFKADNYVSAIACTMQYDARNPSSGRSTGPVGRAQLQKAARATLKLNDRQDATLSRFIVPLINGPSMADLVFALGDKALDAQRNVLPQPILRQQGHIPPTQWETESKLWYSLFMEQLWRSVTSYPSSNSEQSLQYFYNVSKPRQEKEFQALCNAQKTGLPPGFRSFSFFWGVLMVCLGIFVGIVDFCSHRLVSDWKFESRAREKIVPPSKAAKNEAASQSTSDLLHTGTSNVSQAPSRSSISSDRTTVNQRDVSFASEGKGLPVLDTLSISSTQCAESQD